VIVSGTVNYQACDDSRLLCAGIGAGDVDGSGEMRFQILDFRFQIPNHNPESEF